MKKQQAKGIWTWISLVLLVVVLLSYFAQEMQYRNDYSYPELQEDLENGQVAEAVIRQNAQVPTGQVIVLLKNGDQRDMYVNNVERARILFEQFEIECPMSDVPQESKFITVVLPLITAGLLVFLVITMFRRCPLRHRGTW